MLLKKNIVHKSSKNLSFLYTNFLGKILRRFITKKWFSVAAGYYANTTLSKRHIKNFVKKHHIDMNEAERSVSDYQSFNDFFIRILKPTARQINPNENVIVSPADGMITVYDLSSTQQFLVKNKQFNLEDFVKDKQIAQEFCDGMMMIIRLAPWDYHRFHFPVTCVPSQAITITGKYESVDPIVFQAGIQPLTENERQLVRLKTNFNDSIMISVGALCVGKIQHTFTPNIVYKKGQEAGYFCFGGSTIVLLFKPQNIVVEEFILKNSLHKRETSIKMGQGIAQYRYN